MIIYTNNMCIDVILNIINMTKYTNKVKSDVCPSRDFGRNSER